MIPSKPHELPGKPLKKEDMDSTSSPPPKSLVFLRESQASLEKILNERKAILRPDVTKVTVRDALIKLLVLWKDLQVEYLESREYESVLEAQKIVFTLLLIYKTLIYDAPVDTPDPIVSPEEPANPVIEETDVTTDENMEVEANTVIDENADINENTVIGETPPIEETLVTEETSAIEENTIFLDFPFFPSELERLIGVLEEGFLEDDNMIKSISISRRLKLQIILLAFLCQTEELSYLPKFEETAANFSREDIFAAFNKILPRVFNYNLYMKYYDSFLQNFVMSCKSGKLRNSLVSVFDCFRKQFPQFPHLTFEQRHGKVMRELGMESFNLEDCCDRIETRAAVLALEAPIEMARKMFNIWLLLDASEFLTFDDNFMVIYVFSSDFSVFYEQFMRIFYVINRIDESVREIGYMAYSTPRFVSYYIKLYVEMHRILSKLIRALSKNYEIREVESDPLSGAIKRKSEASEFMAAKLKELCIYLTCPLACLDSILRLSLDVTDIPVLFGEEEERFIFTSKVQSILILHDFVASDREKFAEHMVELYPCLDRHFSRFHKSKQMESQGPNTALPPSYHLFASKPPTYDNINDPAQSPTLDLEGQTEGQVGEDCCTRFFKTVLPALIFFLILVAIVFYAISNR